MKQQFIQHTFLKLLLLGFVLLTCAGEAWGLDAETTVTDYDATMTLALDNSSYYVNGNYVYKDANNVTFTLSKTNSGNITYTNSVLKEIELPSGTSKNSCYNYPFSWSAPTGYIIDVTKVEIVTRSYTADVLFWHDCTVRCQILTAPSSTKNQGENIKTNGLANKTISQSLNIHGNGKVYFYYYYAANAAGQDTYINSIKVTYKLTHKRPLFYFKANVGTSGNAMGTAVVGPSTADNTKVSPTYNHTDTCLMGTTSTTYAVYYSATPKTDYQFVGWGATAAATTYENTTTQTNYKVTLTNSQKGTEVEKTLYAIFTKYKPSTTEINFGKVAYNSDPTAKTFTISAHNVGNSISQSGLDGSLFSAAISNFKNDNSNHVCSVKVTLNPSVRSGVVRDTLNISTPRGGTISVVVKADIDPKPTFTWNDQIWDANGNQIKTPIYVDDPILENIVSSNSTGDTTCTVREIEVYGTNNESAVFPTFSNNQITCGKAGRFEFKVDQAKEEGNGYEASSSSRILEIIKRSPELEWNAAVPYYFNETYPNTNYPSVFTLTSGDAELIDNYASTDTDVATFVGGEVTTYNVDRSTTLSVHLAENYKWNSKTFTKPIHPKKMDNHVPFTINSNDKYGTFMQSTSGNIAFESSNVIKMNNGSWTKNENAIVISFTGIPDKLKFSTSTLPDKTLIVPIYPTDGDHNYYAYESSDGNAWTSIWDNTTDLSTSNNVVQLQPTTRFIKLRYYGTVYGQFVNVEVTELHQFDPNPRIIDFGVVNVNKHPQEIAEFSHANAGYQVNVTPAVHFDASPTNIPNTGGDRMGTQPLAITFHPISNVEQSYDERIYFTDQLGNKDSIIVRAQTTFLNVPEFSWNPLERPYYCSPTNPDTTYYIPNICSSSNTSRTLAYETLDNKSGIAEVKNDTLFIYTKTPQEVTIKVSQPEVTDQWMAHEETYTFTTRLKPELSVPFVMTEDIFVNKNYTIYSPLWSRSGIFNVKWTQHNDQYGWDNQYGIRLGGEDQTAWADWHAFDYPWLPSMSWEDKYAIFEFEGAPDSLFFTYFTNKGGILGVSDAYWYVAVGKNGKDWNVIWEAYEATFPNNDPSLAPNIEMALPHDARFIKFCYSGNFAGYFKDIRITAFDGYYFLKTSDNLYLSRGGATPNVSAVVDDYGIAIRKSKVSNSDNSKKFTRLEYVDNGRYLCQSGNSLITNETSNVKFVEKEQTDGTVVYTNINEDRYIAPNADRTLTLSTTESQAIRWHLEKPSVHEKAMAALNDEQVRSATFEFGEEIESLDKLRGRLFNEDYTKEIVLDTHHETSEQQEVSNGSADVYPNGENGVVNNLKEGLYRLSVKALYRIGPNKRAIEAHVGGYDCPTAYVYVDDLNSTNKAKTRLHSVYDFAQGENKGDGGHPDFSFRYNDSTAYYPNGTTSATYHFGLENSYENDVYIFIHKDENTGKGSLRYGIKAPSNANDSNWLCYQRITLTRLYRKEFIFDNGGVDKDSLWNNSTNWEYEGTHNHGMIPGLTHKVIIDAPVIVTGEETGAYSVSYGENAKGSIIVKPGASLSVREGGFSEEYLGTQNHITLEANEKGQTGALFLCPGIKAPNATVQFYSVIANPEDNEEWDWQYIGSPVTKETVDYNERLFYNCWLYQHNTITDAWSNAGNWNKMEPFRGYMFTRNDGKTGTYGTRPSTGPLFAYSGQLNLAKDTVLTLQHEGGKCDNFIANSWAAPISISKFNERDFIDIEKTIYIWDKSGQCISIPLFNSENVGKDTLSAMQGFMVKSKAKGAKLNLEYEKLVWKNDITTNGPLKAPMRSRWDDDVDEVPEAADLLSRLCITMMSEDSVPDYLYLLEKEDEGFSREFTEGYDAPKYFVDGLPCIYTYETSGKHLSVSATDNVVGTYLAINTNASQNYTLTFSKVIGEGLGLRDLVTNTIVPITEGMQYAFTAPANSSPMLRFVVVEHEETPQWNNNNGTSLEDLGGEFKIWQSGEILSVIGAGSHASLRIYDAAGKLILSEFFNEATAINLNALPTGVYMVQVNDKTEKVLR